jgi:hypothetical protein
VLIVIAIISARIKNGKIYLRFGKTILKQITRIIDIYKSQPEIPNDVTVREEKGISTSFSTPSIRILIRYTLRVRKGTARCSFTQNNKNEINPRGTIKNSTRGTNIRFAGSDINDKIPKELTINGMVAKDAPIVILALEIILS